MVQDGLQPANPFFPEVFHLFDLFGREDGLHCKKVFYSHHISF